MMQIPPTVIDRLAGVVGVLCAAAFLACPDPAAAQAAPAPGMFQQNIFYGDVPPGGDAAPVLVFVHGMNTNAASWWTPPNDMYARAYAAGYRTAFVSLSEDNSPNNAAIDVNAVVFAKAVPSIIAHYKVPNVYVIAHSKGGIDVQAGMISPAISFYIKAVFTIATPHQGTELADWAFGPGQPIAAGLGLLSPATFSIQTSVMVTQARPMLDPSSTVAGVPFFTIAGTSFAAPPNPLLAQTGPILGALTGGQPNDGIVTVPRTKLPAAYASDLGTIPANHFASALGVFSFPRIHAQIQLMEGGASFHRIATDGFAFDGAGNPLGGDRQNSFPWSTQWFKGRLYVGTGRAFICVAQATADAASGITTYPPKYPDIECAPDPKDLPLQAEIWRYTPKTHTWERVYQSPNDVPIEFDENGVPTRFTARDIAYRGMAVFQENRKKGQKGPGRERLYVGAINASSLFDTLPAYSDPSVRRFPPPRMLYTNNGKDWHEVPQKPGTFFGDLNIQTEARLKRGFRSFAVLRDAKGVNRLFVTVSDLIGVGRIIMSENPSAGNNAWRQVSPNADDFPVFTIYPHRNQLWVTATVGGTNDPRGYGVFKTDAKTRDPNNRSWFLFEPVATPGELQLPLFRPDAAISMQEFQGSLYVGSDRPSELIRINPDDTWDLIVGQPRLTMSGFKRPLSGIGKGFQSLFNGHFYSMAVDNGELYLGTWDWSQMLRGTIADGFFNFNYGFDLFKSKDGIHWQVVSRTGLGDGLNSSVRNLESTPFGLFLAATNPFFGLQMFQSTAALDLNHDGIVDAKDVATVWSARRTPAEGRTDPRDMNRDGMIRRQDARLLSTQCTYPACASGPGTAPAAPSELKAEGTASNVLLHWTGVENAVQYHVYRSDSVALEDVIPASLPIALQGGATITLDGIRNGEFDALCASALNADTCELIEAARTNARIDRPMRWIGASSNPSFIDVEAPLHGSVYAVAAEDEHGRLSETSNIVSSPTNGAW
jgi:pimeloyl-ACP methyl ester carboxylesterase